MTPVLDAKASESGVRDGAAKVTLPP